MTKEFKTQDKILIIDDFHPDLLAGLDRANLSYDYRPNWSGVEILREVAPYQGLLVRSKIFCDSTFFNIANTLKWIARGGSGMDNIDVTAAHNAGVTLMNAPEANRDAVAEHTLGLMLGLANKMGSAFIEMNQGLFRREPNRGVELGGKTLGIIGYGNAGSALAHKVTGLGMNVMAYDKYKTVPLNEPAQNASMQQIFEHADWVSLHIPLTPETHNLVCMDWIQKFRKPIRIINTSRGNIASTQDIFYALTRGVIAGYAADVLENEKPQTRSAEQTRLYLKLASLNSVLLTPHVAGWTRESEQRIAQVLLQKILHWYSQHLSC